MRRVVALLTLILSAVVVICLAACSSDGPSGAPKHDLHLNISYDSNLIFAKYDVEISVDDDLEGTITQGSSISRVLSLEEGQHTVTFSNVEDADVNVTKSISLQGETHFSCTLKAHNGSIELQDVRLEKASLKRAGSAGSEKEISEKEITEPEDAATDEGTAEPEEEQLDELEAAKEQESTKTEDEAKKAAAIKAAALAKSALKATELKGKSKYLEYSKKSVDPLKLVECSDEKVAVGTDNKVDLSKVGKKEVAYKLSLDGQVAERRVTFTVRDTKAPVIKLVEKKPSVKKGKSYDAMSNIASVKDKVDGGLKYVKKAPKAKGKKAGLEDFYDKGWYTIKGKVDTSTPGAHWILVTASDKHGNVKTKEFAVKVTKPKPAVKASQAKPKAEKYTYILNTSTKVFHLPGCRYAKIIKSSNRLEKTATKDEIERMGYNSCGWCNP